MQTQKVKNKKVVDLIYYLLSALLGFGVLIIVLASIFFILTIFKPDFEPFFPVIDISLEISEKGTLLLKSGSQKDILVDSATVSFNVNEKYGFPGILNYLFFMSVLGFGFYIIFLLWKIFRSMRLSLKNDNPFHLKNVWRIRLIAFTVLLSAVMQILYPLILKYFWFQKIQIFKQSFDIQLNFDALFDVFWALIIFVGAEIYRVGLEIKKDQELTI